MCVKNRKDEQNIIEKLIENLDFIEVFEEVK